MLDALELLDPGHQVVCEVDHSSGHAKQREDGLHALNMNIKYGGKQKQLRDTVVADVCLGPGEANMYYADRKWSTNFSKGGGGD